MGRDMIPDSLFICSFKGWEKNMSKEKKFVLRVGAIFVLLLGFALLSKILQIKSEHGINQNRGLYFQPENTIEVAFLGTSHIHCNVNTALLWEKYGIASYDYSGAEQPLWMTYHYLKEFYKHQTPEVVVLDLYAPARFKEDYQYDWISENIYGMRFSLNKLSMLMVSVEADRLMNYFPDFAVYHGRYDELEKEDFTHFFWNENHLESFKGYTPYWNHISEKEISNQHGVAGGLTKKSEKYLRKIIEFMDKQDGELVLIVAPYLVVPEDEETYEEIQRVAKEYGIEVWNYNDKMDLRMEDLHDASHLNYWGSCKFTELLGRDLKQNYDLTDHRGEEEYESWDEHVRKIDQEVAYEKKKK